MHRPDSSPKTSERPRLGLALGSGAARGWAHVGVLRALDEWGVEVDVYAGCSVGALIGAARLLDIWDPFLDWARSLSAIDAMATFGISLSRGGVVNPDKAFTRFAEHDKPIEELPKPFAAVATDLATGHEVWLDRGSALNACRASSSVPMILQAARYQVGYTEHWLIDGGASNPVPVNLARALGAERVISVDLNTVTLALSRFNRPNTTAVIPAPDPDEGLTGPFAPLAKAFGGAKRDLVRRMALARAKSQAQPQLFETAAATIDIIQGQLAQARAYIDVADVRLTPDLSCASAAAFDHHEEFERIGYETAQAQKQEILAVAGLAPDISKSDDE